MPAPTARREYPRVIQCGGKIAEACDAFCLHGLNDGEGRWRALVGTGIFIGIGRFPRRSGLF